MALRGDSVDDGIAPELCSLSYVSTDDAVNLILEIGKGTHMVKVNLKDAYCVVPIHPRDHNLLAVSWRGQAYVDWSLPFGLRSALRIFTAIVEALSWALHHRGIEHQLHFLDDFLFLGRPGSDEAAHCLLQELELMNEFGIPIATHKIEGPSTTLTFPGILIDSQLLRLRLPADKLPQLQCLLQSWCHK